MLNKLTAFNSANCVLSSILFAFVGCFNGQMRLFIFSLSAYSVHFCISSGWPTAFSSLLRETHVPTLMQSNIQKNRPVHGSFFGLRKLMHCVQIRKVFNFRCVFLPILVLSTFQKKKSCRTKMCYSIKIGEQMTRTEEEVSVETRNRFGLNNSYEKIWRKIWIELISTGCKTIVWHCHQIVEINATKEDARGSYNSSMSNPIQFARLSLHRLYGSTVSCLPFSIIDIHTTSSVMRMHVKL